MAVWSIRQRWKMAKKKLQKPKKLQKKMLQKKAKDRYSAQQCLKHPFFDKKKKKVEERKVKKEKAKSRSLKINKKIMQYNQK